MLKKNDIVKVEITDIGFGGEGIAKKDGYTLFIKNAALGDVVMAKILKPNKNYAYAKIESFIKKSEIRQDSVCSAFPKCGGCEIMHIKYKNQLQIKENIVKNNIYKITSYKEGDFKFYPIIPSPDEYFYRNKAQIPVGKQNGSVEIGFFASKSHRIIPFERCMISRDNINKIAKICLEFIKINNLSVYDEQSHKGVIRNIYIRDFDNSSFVCFVTNSKKKIENIEVLAKELEKYNVTSIVQNINTNKSNVILGEKNITLWGEDYVLANLFDLTFKISPHSFFQVNTKQTENLYAKAVEYANLSENDTVLDLYCGVGTITLSMAKKAGRAIGVEIVEDAILNAKENAKMNGIENAVFYAGDAFETVNSLLKDGLKADVVVVDPPRKGCSKELLDLIETISPKRVVYVSCNSSTLARDVEILKEKGYILKKLTPVDMFPNTTHVECVALLKNKTSL